MTDSGAAGVTGAAALEGSSRRVLRRALICIRHLREDLDVMRSAYAEREDLPGLRTLVDAMSALLAEAEREVILLSRRLFDQLRDGNRPARDEAVFAERANAIANVLDRSFPGLMAIVRDPHGREIEALFAPLTELLARLHQEEPRSIELILVPGDEYSYEISVIDRLEKAAEYFDEDPRDLLRGFPRLVAVTYPKQREADILIHMMLVHELAHTVLDLRPDPEEAAPITGAFDKAGDDHYDAILEKFGGKGEEAERNALANEALWRMGRWFDEFACDAMALALVGPAYVFALADFDLTPSNWTQPRFTGAFETHPGMAMRLRRVIQRARAEYLPEGPRGEAARMLSEGMDALQAEIPDDEEGLEDEERALLEDALARLTPEVVASVLAQARYLRGEFEDDVELVWEKLQAGMPPAERIFERLAETGRLGSLSEVPREWSEPMAWQAIINGSFAWWLAERPLRTDDGRRTFPDRRNVARDWIAFNSFVRGSIELANLHGSLRESSERLDGLNVPVRRDA